MKVYVVTQGDYSDYHICGVADTMEKAQKLVKYFERNHYYASPNIETYDTDAIQCIGDKKRWHVVQTLPLTIGEKTYGDVSISVTERTIYSVDELYEKSEIKEYKSLIDGRYRYSATITAKDEEHALKIFYDKLAEYKAEQQGIAVSLAYGDMGRDLL